VALRHLLLAVAGAAAFFVSPAMAQVAGPSNRVITKTNLALNTNTVICPAPSGEPLKVEIFFTVSGVGVGFNGGTLTTATPGTTANTTPDWATAAANAYYLFPIVPSNAITAYGAAGMVVCVQTMRQ
jgi:hypothetical protein